LGQRPVPGGNWYGEKQTNIADLQFAQDFQRLQTFGGENADAHVDYNFGNATLTSISAYQHFKKNMMNEIDGTPANVFAYGTVADFKTFTQELRLSGTTPNLRWVAGAYYMHKKAWNAQTIKATSGSAFAVLYANVLQGTPGFPDFGITVDSGFDAIEEATLITDSTSVFGQTEWQFAPKWTLVTGLRFIDERQDFNWQTYLAQNNNNFEVTWQHRLGDTVLDGNFADKRTQNLWAGKAQLEFRPSDGVLLFAGVNRGVKAGAYNGKLYDFTPNYPANRIPYKAEVLWNYEGGIKYTGGKFSTSASVYHYDYKDFQAFLFTDLNGVVSNADAKIDGIDADFSFKATKDLLVRVGGSVFTGGIKHFAVTPGIFRNVELPYAPKQSAVLSLNYMIPTVVSGGKLGLSALYSYTSDYFITLRNFSAHKYPSRQLLNLDLGWKSNSNGLRLSAYLKNAFDKRWLLGAYDNTTSAGNIQEVYGDPRTFGVAVGYDY
jgi:iron complex outermembrane recepter protein